MELTKQEAIELLSERYMTMSMCADKDYCAKQNAALDIAIAALNTDFTTEEARNLINNQKAEGIKEFAERLKEKFGIADCIVTINNNDIDKLVNEMTENENEYIRKRIHDDFMKSCKRL